MFLHINKKCLAVPDFFFKLLVNYLFAEDDNKNSHQNEILKSPDGGTDIYQFYMEKNGSDCIKPFKRSQQLITSPESLQG